MREPARRRAPLGNGTSQPPAERTVTNLREQGHSVAIDDEALARVSDYFVALAAAEGLPTGQPQEFDADYFRHQLPGGMVGTTRRQLAEIKLLDRLPAVLEEVSRVRAELGYPIMVTPFSQIIVDPGGHERDGQRALQQRSRRGHPLCGREIRQADRASRCKCTRQDSVVCRERGSFWRNRTMPELSELRRRFPPTSTTKNWCFAS